MNACWSIGSLDKTACIQRMQLLHGAFDMPAQDMNVGACLAVVFATLPHNPPAWSGCTNSVEIHSVHGQRSRPSGPVKKKDGGDKSHRTARQRRRVLLPVSTRVSHTAGGTRRRRRPSASWNRLQREQTTTTTHLHRVAAALSQTRVGADDGFGVCGLLPGCMC
jgi:hypothetical protein